MNESSIYMTESGEAAPQSGTLPVEDTRELSLLFHLNSEPWLNDEAYELASANLPLIDPGERPVVDLPGGAESPLLALLRARHSCRSFAARQMPLATLAALLAGTQGIVGAGEASFLRRATPSAGGLFPLDLHVFVRRIDGLADGLHRYDPLSHALIELDRDDVSSRLAAAVYAYPFIIDANALFALVARFPRTQDKYGPRGYRYILLEAGHCAQNLILRAAELGLGALCIGGFADGLINAQLGLNPTLAGAVYLVAAGFEAV
jgi:SagB-type dehydrogenase family enzyme